MPFVEFLKSTVLMSAGAATALAAATVVGAAAKGEQTTALVAMGWWLTAALAGLVIGRREQASQAITRLLADARVATQLPEQRPVRVLLDRLWPLFVTTLVAMALGLFLPQVSGVATGFAIAWAMSLRRQHAAVEAIERRDGVRFHVEPSSPVRPISLTRTPGFKAYVPEV